MQKQDNITDGIIVVVLALFMSYIWTTLAIFLGYILFK